MCSNLYKTELMLKSFWERLVNSSPCALSCYAFFPTVPAAICPPPTPAWVGTCDAGQLLVGSFDLKESPYLCPEIPLPPSFFDQVK